MFFDLNIPLPVPALLANHAHHSKQKQTDYSLCLFSAVQIAALETRIDIFVHLGYTVLALSQVCQSKIDAKTHVDHLSGLMPKLKKRNGVQLLKRLTIVLDEASEKGNGINIQNTALLSFYDILSVRPFTSTTFSAACLTYSVPSQATTHIISIPTSHSARLPYHLKHTLVRTAISNGSVFEIDYAGALSSDESERKFWWGGLREVIRVTKGKGLLLSGGIGADKDARAPRDAANLITLAGLSQNLSHDAISQTAKTTVLRAHSRKTYRSILSPPTLILPSVESSSTATLEVMVTATAEGTQQLEEEPIATSHTAWKVTGDQDSTRDPQEISHGDFSVSQTPRKTQSKQKQKQKGGVHPGPDLIANTPVLSAGETSPSGSISKKRPRADSDQHDRQKPAQVEISSNFNDRSKKRKKKR